MQAEKMEDAMRYIFIGAIILAAILVPICIRVFKGVAGVGQEDDVSEEVEMAEKMDLVCAMCSERDACPHGLKRVQSCTLLVSAQLPHNERDSVFGM